MSSTTNHVTVTGVVAQDPVFREISQTSCKHEFSVWTEREWKDKAGKWKRDSDFVDVVAWNNRWLSQSVHAGDWIHITGRLQRRFYKCGCGEQHYTMEILSREIKNMSRAVVSEGKGIVDQFYHGPLETNGNGGS